MQKHKWEDITGILFMLVSVALLGVSVFLCFSEDIWYDELFTMGLGNQSLGELISITARDVHPPLYYIIVKLALSVLGAVFGSVNQVVIAKLVSVLPFLLCMIYAVTKIRRNFGMLTAGLYSFLLLTMPNMADYTVEVRMYGYALFFITAGMLHAYEICGSNSANIAEDTKRDKKNHNLSYVNWIALTVYSLAACYTHYFACVAACMIYVYLFVSFLVKKQWKDKYKSFLLSGAICAVGYLPWILSVVTAQVGKVSENYWIQPLSWRTIGGCVKFLFQPFFSNAKINVLLAVVLLGCFALLFVLTMLHDLKKNKAEGRTAAGFVLGSVSVLGGLVLFGFVASFLIRPIFVYRYMLPAMGVFWLALAILTVRIKHRKYLFIPLMLLLLVVGIRNYHAFYGEEMWKKVQMSKTENALSQIPEDAVLICNFDQTQAVITYYLPNNSYLWYGSPEPLICEMYPSNHSLVENFSDETGMEQIKTFLKNGQQVYFFGSGNAREEILEKWKNNDILSEEKADVLLERYWFKIYKISM